MEFIADIARKSGESNLLAVEAAKASRAREIGRDSGLFSVPKVVNFDPEIGVLEFERLNGLATLLDLAVREDGRLSELLKKAGRALAVIHEELTLPEEMKHELPPEWMDPADRNVFIHGDFACINVCFHEPSGELVILDWSGAPMVGRTPTFGSRYFDILLFASSVFHGAPFRRALRWHAKAMTDAFLDGYAKAAPEVELNKFKDYSSKICRLQRYNIRKLARQRRPIRALGFLLCQMLMHARFCLFLRGREP
ncbi:MAG: BUD32 family EKC/KEOPS complex subunit [Planctomycetota bacterium]|jgi:tRNA A-37 threonylcarbamoyl transferase component Bud32